MVLSGILQILITGFMMLLKSFAAIHYVIQERINVSMKKLWSKNFILIVLASTLQNAQMHMVNPIMSKYTGSIGIGLDFTGAIVGAFSVAALVSRPLSGSLTGKYHARVLSALSSLLMGTATLFYIYADERTMLIIRFVHGFSYGICTTVFMAVAGRLLTAENMRQGMGYFGLGQVLSIAAAPAIGIYLQESMGYQAVFIISAVVSAAAGLMAVFVKAEKGKNQKTERFSLKSMLETAPKASVAAVITIAASLETAYIVIYGEGLGILNMGLYFTVSASVMLIVRGLMGRRINQASYRKIMVPSLIAMASAMGLLAWAGFMGGGTALFLMFMGASAIKSAGQGIAQPAIQAECMKKGEAGGAASYYMGCDLGQSIGPIAGGYIASAMGYPFIYLFAGILLIAAVIFVCFTSAGNRR